MTCEITESTQWYKEHAVLEGRKFASGDYRIKLINEKGRTKAGGGWISSIETGEVPQPVKWNPFDWYEKTDLWKDFKKHAPDIKLFLIGESTLNFQKQYELLENLIDPRVSTKHSTRL